MSDTEQALHDVAVMLRKDYKDRTGEDLPPPPPAPRAAPAWLRWGPPLVFVAAVIAFPFLFPGFGRTTDSEAVEGLRAEIKAVRERLDAAEARAKELQVQVEQTGRLVKGLDDTWERLRKEGVKVTHEHVTQMAVYGSITLVGKAQFPVRAGDKKIALRDRKWKTVLEFDLAPRVEWFHDGKKIKDGSGLKGELDTRLTFTSDGQKVTRVEVTPGALKDEGY